MRAVKGSLGHSPKGKEVQRIRRPSLGLMARLGKSIAKQSEGRVGEKCLPVGGRVKKLRAVEDQSASIPKETTSALGRNMWIGGDKTVRNHIIRQNSQPSIQTMLTPFYSHFHLRSHVLYCVDSLILAAVSSAEFSNVLST